MSVGLTAIVHDYRITQTINTVTRLLAQQSFILSYLLVPQVSCYDTV